MILTSKWHVEQPFAGQNKQTQMLKSFATNHRTIHGGPIVGQTRKRPREYLYAL